MNPYSLRFLFLANAFLLGLCATSSHAATFAISNLNDSGTGSLRQAVVDANVDADADTIVFDADLSGTLTLTGGVLSITSPLTIEGPGAAALSVSGNQTSRLFNVSGAGVVIRGLTLRDGKHAGKNGRSSRLGTGGVGYPGQGGAIYNTGTLSLREVVLSSNSAIGGMGGRGRRDSTGMSTRAGMGGAGGVAQGGAIYNTGTVTLTNARLEGNSAVGGRGGDGDGSPGGSGGDAKGGAIYNAGSLAQDNTVFNSNSVVAGVGGVSRGGDGVAEEKDVYTYIPTPQVASFSPLNASDKVGTKRTFSVTVSHPNGAGAIKEVWLLVNKQLSWNAGATLIYVPSAATPTKGQLFLRSGDAFLPPVPIGVNSGAVLNNGAVSFVARDVTVAITSTGMKLDFPLVIRDGLVGTNRLFVRAVDKAGYTDKSAAPSDSGYRRFGNYTVTPQFRGATNNAPTLSSLSPEATNSKHSSAGLGAVETFSFSARDADGTGDIESLWFSAGKSSNWTRSATFIYTPQTHRLVLRSDDGQSFVAGGVVGSAGILENSQVRVDLSKVRVQAYNDGRTLALTLPLQAKTGLLGQNRVWLRVQDLGRATAPNSDAQGYVQSGTWNVAQEASGNRQTAPSGGGA